MYHYVEKIPVLGSASVTLTSKFLSLSPQQSSLLLISTLLMRTFKPRWSAIQGYRDFFAAQNVEEFESAQSFGGFSSSLWDVATPRGLSRGKAQAAVPEITSFLIVAKESELFNQQFRLL